MNRYTAIIWDAADEENFVFHLSAAAPEDCEAKIKHWQFQKAVNDGDTDFDDVDVESDIEAAVDLDVLAVFPGEHENLIAGESGVETRTIPENWVITIPDKE